MNGPKWPDESLINKFEPKMATGVKLPSDDSYTIAA